MSLSHVSSRAIERIAPPLTIDVLREQIAPGASNAELTYFAQVCTSLDLSPFADQIVLIGRWDKRVKRRVYRHQITVAGRRALATRTGQLAGIEGPVWCGPRTEPGAPLNWQEVWDDESQPPYCARVLVYRHRCVVPFNGTAKWSEMAQYDNDDNLLPLWRQMPSHMLGKVAESLALRRAFGDVVTPDAVSGFSNEDDIEVVEATAMNAIDIDEVTGELDQPTEPDETEPAAGAHHLGGEAADRTPADTGSATQGPGVPPSPPTQHAGPTCDRCREPIIGNVEVLGKDDFGHIYAHRGGCPSQKDERV